MPTVQIPSLAKRVLQICCSIAWCLVAAGPIFGFAALKPILISEGIYSERCDVGSVRNDAFDYLSQKFVLYVNIDTLSKDLTPCVDQDLSLNLMFTLAAVVTNVAALPVGSILDEYGPRVCGMIGSFLIFLASLILKYGKELSENVPWFDAYLIGYSTLALGGPFVFISCFQLANSFPKNSGLVLALLTGAFDTSLALFLIYRIIYTNMYKLTLNQFFTAYLIIPAFIFICQVTVMPKDSYKTVGTLAKIGETAIDETGKPIDRDLLKPQDRDDTDEDQSVQTYAPQPTIGETTSLLIRRASVPRRDSVVLRFSYASRNSAKSVYEQDAEDKLIESSGGVFGILHGCDIAEQLKSSWFILMTFFTTIQMLRINYFVATIRSQELYLYKGNEDIAISINHFFDLALPLGGLISIPFIGLLLDNLTTLSILEILTGISLVIGVMGLLSWLPATYLGIILLVVYRPFYYTAVSDFCAKVFGFDTFGTVYGAIICFSGVCNILQQVMDKATHEYFNMNPIPINALLTVLTAIFGFALIVFVRTQEMNLKRKDLEIEAQEASIRDVPH